MLTWIRGHSADVVDVFVYIVVLNLAIEYVPSVISESFSLSILTALLLKITLEVVIAAKTFVMTRLKDPVGGGAVGAGSREQVPRPRAHRTCLR